jgi:hypothetical protein
MDSAAWPETNSSTLGIGTFGRRHGVVERRKVSVEKRGAVLWRLKQVEWKFAVSGEQGDV